MGVEDRRRRTERIGTDRPWAVSRRLIVVMVLAMVCGATLLQFRSTDQVAADAWTGPAAVPGAPIGLHVSSRTATSLTLRWGAPSGHGSAVTDYVVQHRSEAGDWVTFPDGEDTSNSVTVTDLVRSSPYQISVTAVNAVGAGPAATLGGFTITVGDQHGCAIDGGGVVHCWGEIIESRRNPHWRPVEVAGLSGVVDLTSGEQHVCALVDDGTARCWGETFLGRLGNGVAFNGGSSTPVVVSGLSGVRSLAAGGQHTCAAGLDGSVRCWGDNSAGKLGLGPSDSRPLSAVPLLVDSLTDVISVSAGAEHTCALRLDRTVECWGSNYYGQLGDGSTFDSAAPVPVPGLADVVAIDAGDFHTCAVLLDTSAVCWGRGEDGQLGDGSLVDSLSPVLVSGLAGVVSISAGASHSCASMSDGTAACWGANIDSRLGDGTTTASALPVTVEGLSGVTVIVAGGNHSCAMSEDGQPRCWGANDQYQLGRYTATPTAPSPGPVADDVGEFWIIRAIRWNPTAEMPATSPSAPTALELETRGEHRITLTWLPPDDDGGLPVLDYVIEYSIDGTEWVQLEDPVWSSTGAVLTGLERGVPVSVRVSAGNALGYGESTELLTVTPATLPSAPLSVVVTAHTESSVSLAWQAPDDGGAAITDYGVQYWNGYMWATFDDGVSTSTEVTVTGLRRGISYLFRVFAVNDVGIGPFQPPMSTVAAGGLHSCTVLRSGGSACWGLNTGGQLGSLEPFGSSRVPVLISGSAAVASIHAGDFHSCRVLQDRTLQCWGENDSGQLGIGQRFPAVEVPWPVSGVTGVIDVGLGRLHTCAALVGGEVWCWGGDGSGQLGTSGGPSFTRIPLKVPDLDDVVSIDASDDQTCAVTVGGRVACWGANADGQLGTGGTTDSDVPIEVAGVDGIVKAALGSSFTCALRHDGTVWCWGDLLGGDSNDALWPTMVSGLSDVVDLVAGAQHACALLVNGSMYCWGSNFSGQLGIGSLLDEEQPHLVELEPVTAIDAGGHHTCAVLRTGGVRCWGANSDGELGDGTITGSSVPVPVSSILGAPAVVAGTPSTVPGSPSGLQSDAATWNSVSLRWDAPLDDGGIPLIDFLVEVSTDGATWSIVDDGVSSAASATVTGLSRGIDHRFRVSAVNADGSGAPSSVLAVRTSTAPLRPIDLRATERTPTSVTLQWTAPDDGGAEITDYIVEYAATTVGSTWAVAADGVSATTSATVGDLTPGQSYRFRVAARNSSGTGPTSASGRVIDATRSQACAVTTEGSVMCWGADPEGRRADGTWSGSLLPTSIGELDDVVAVTTGGAHACALSGAGSVHCWGDNTHGQLGDGTRTRSAVPVLVPDLSGVVSIDAGEDHTCAVVNDGAAFCWGNRGPGKLGDGTLQERLIPTAVLLPMPVVSITAGGNHSCALAIDRRVWCWGYHGRGQLGDGSSMTDADGWARYATRPVEVADLASGVEIAAGEDHTCALRLDGSVVCWGANANGQLGNGTTVDSPSPVSVLHLASVESLAGGLAHSCAVTSDQEMYCWGQNIAGELTDGTMASSKIPVRGATGVTTVTAGRQFSCAIAPDLSVRCWGSNSVGELGDGTISSSLLGAVVDGIEMKSPGVVASAAASVPGAPTSVSGVSGIGQVVVSWTAPSSNGGSPVTGYTVSASPQVGGVTRTCTSASTSCTVTGLTNGTAYTFTVKASNAVGASSASTASSAVTPSTVPGLPSGVYAVRGNGSVTIYWTAAADNGGSAITNYQAQAYNTAFGNAILGKTCSNNIFRFCTITGLTNGTDYRFAVRATNVKGWGSFTAQTAKVAPSASTATAPGVPSGVVITPGNREVTVAWTAPVNNGATITAYKVQAYGAAGAALSSSCTVNATASTATTCTITGLTNDTTYGFAVNATNSKGSSAYTSITQVQPTLVKIRRGNAKVTASWTFTAPSTVGGSAFSSYQVQAYTSAGVAIVGKTCTPVGLAKSCDITGLTNGTSYAIAVLAKYANGTSITTSRSITVAPSALVGALVPSAPTGVTALAGVKQATVSWTAAAPNGATVTLYTVQAYNPTTNVAVATKLCTTSVTSCIVTGLTTGTSYYFKVTARNDVGTSAASIASTSVTAG